MQEMKIAMSTQAWYRSFPFLFKSLIYTYKTTNSDQPLPGNSLKPFSQKASTSYLLLVREFPDGCTVYPEHEQTEAIEKKRELSSQDELSLLSSHMQ